LGFLASLISITEYKAWLQVSGTANDALYTILVDAVSADVRRSCGRDLTNGFNSGTFTEYFDGTGEETIQLSEWPVTSITSVTRRYADASTETLSASTYRVDLATGVLSRIDAVRSRFPVSTFGTVETDFGAEPQFESGFQNFTVVYVGGYSTIPSDLKMACYQLCDLARGSIGMNGNVSSERIGDYSVTYADPDKAAAIKANLIRTFNTMGA
jgi:hypothetical protein